MLKLLQPEKKKILKQKDLLKMSLEEETKNKRL